MDTMLLTNFRKVTGRTDGFPIHVNMDRVVMVGPCFIMQEGEMVPDPAGGSSLVFADGPGLTVHESFEDIVNMRTHKPG